MAAGREYSGMKVCLVRPVFLLVGLLLAACAAHAQGKDAPAALNEADGQSIPFAYDPPAVPLPVVQASVNGSAPLPFLVDTGTNVPLILNPWAAARLGLTTSAAARTDQGTVSGTAPIHSVALQGEGHKNDVTVALSQAFVSDVSPLTGLIIGPRVAGIIGLGLLTPVTSRFDFTAKTLTVFVKPHPPLRFPGAATLPLTPTPDGKIAVAASLAPSQSVGLLVDTGSTGTQVPLSALAWADSRLRMTVSGARQLSAFYIVPTLSLPHVALGDLQAADVVVGAMPSSAIGSLGLNVLARFRLTLDLPNHQAFLEQHSGGSEARQEGDGWTGISVASAGATWTVSRFNPGSPAQTAGLRVGDILTAVDGHPLAGLSLFQVDRLKEGVAGTVARLTVQRGAAKPFAVSFRRPDVFAAPPFAVNGLVLKRPDGGPLTVLGVLPGSAGDKAGLRVDDEISRINALPMATMTLDKLLNALTLPTLRLTVQRAGVAKAIELTLTAATPH